MAARAAPADPPHGEAGQDYAQAQPQSDLLDELVRTTNQHAIVTDAPEERFRLGFFTPFLLVINQMIGTGIFVGPTLVMQGTRSSGGALLLWFFDIFYGLAGTHVYIEYGLNVPRYVIEGLEQAVPRCGGDLHYLQFVSGWPHYKKDTVLLMGTLFGISFIFVRNMASNCINFAVRVLQAARSGDEPKNGEVRAIAIAIAIAAAAFACVVHVVSRRYGIWLNNLLAVVKVCILLVIIFTTLAVLGGGVHDEDGNQVPNVLTQNIDPKVAFKEPGTVTGYAASFLSIIFAYSGFEQANYVLGEVATPRRTFPRAAISGMALVSVLYMLVNICYMVVVPAYEQSTDEVALLFFRKTFSWVPGDGSADRIFNAFLALSSFGNVIVMTYTAARMKQEIAKQGFLPFPRFFGQNVDLSIGRLIAYLRMSHGWKLRYLSPEQHREATPVGALVLHLLSCFVLILATVSIKPDDAYTLLSGLMAFLSTALFGCLLAVGILILRFRGPPATEPAKTKDYRSALVAGSAADETTVPIRKTWSELTGSSVYPWLSVISAVVYFVGNAFPLIASWIPATANFSSSTVAWWWVPTTSVAILLFATLWWFGFLAGARHRERHQQKRLIHEIWPEFEWAEQPAADRDSEDSEEDGRPRHGGKILVHERPRCLRGRVAR
ncbi:amino acid permease-domain-containing protein [Podospora appendiculata]|uniref:Amino acid permease-domain-containing protein n=1 Tax=Podospora appendiculata TaxID=314037 RepID=A0AAE1C7N8_9PEZI|nr:amino acid permease-domain-containing protein [Podospora appendiculata]